MKWPPVPLRHCARSIRDGTHGTYDRTADGKHLLSAKNLANGRVVIGETESLIADVDYVEIVRNRRFQPGDVLVTIVGTIGRVALLEEGDPLAFQRSVAAITPGPSYERRFLFYVMQSTPFQDQLILRQNQSAQAGVYLGQLAAIAVPRPPMDRQRAIVDFLDHETTRIEALHASKKKLLALLHTKIRLSLDGLLEASAGAWIPLKRVLRPERDALIAGPFGSDLAGPDLAPEGDVPIFDQRTVMDDEFGKFTHFVSSQKAKSLVRFLVFPGDLLVTGRGTIGKVVTVPGNSPAGILHPCLLRVRLDEKVVSADLVHLTLNWSERAQRFLRWSSSATTIEVIYSPTLKETPIPLIRPDHQDRVLAQAREMIEQSEQLHLRLSTQLRLLREHRQSLITAAVTGELDLGAVA